MLLLFTHWAAETDRQVEEDKSIIVLCTGFDDVRPVDGQACLAASQCCMQHSPMRVCLLARQGKAQI